MAKANPFRFSTKYQDDETDLLYYGLRYYSASMGRWLARDRIEEKGGRNLYAFARNNAIGRIDVLGKKDFVWVDPPEEVDLGKPGGPGFAFFRPFAPEAEVYSGNGCCFAVRLSGGTARVRIEYNQGEIFGENILEHERYHVTHHFRPAYSDYKSAAAALGAPCMTKGRAMCIKAVILSELSAEYQKRVDRDGAAYDYLDYGWQDPSQQDAWQRMQETEEDYQNAVSATGAAAAACPSE